MPLNVKDELKKAYPKSRDFHDKVDRMSVEQAQAIYIRLKNERKLGK